MSCPWGAGYSINTSISAEHNQEATTRRRRRQTPPLLHCMFGRELCTCTEEQINIITSLQSPPTVLPQSHLTHIQWLANQLIIIIIIIDSIGINRRTSTHYISPVVVFSLHFLKRNYQSRAERAAATETLCSSANEIALIIKLLI